MKAIIVLGLLFCSTFTTKLNGHFDFWHNRWCFFMGFAALVVAWSFRKKVNALPLITFVYVIWTAIYNFSWIENQYVGNNIDIQFALKFHAADGVMRFALVALAAVMLLDYKKTVLYTLAVLNILDSSFVVAQWIYGNDYLWRGGFWGNGTANGSIIGFTYPLILMLPIKNIYLKVFCLVVPIVAIFCSMTSIPVGVIMLSTATYFFFTIKGAKAKSILTISCILFFMGIGYILGEKGKLPNGTTNPKEFFSSSDRFSFWKITLDAFQHSKYKAIGNGGGTFILFGPLIQLKNKYKAGVDSNGKVHGEFHLYAHNDFIEVLFENGYIGLVLGVLSSLLALIMGVIRKQYILVACFTSYLGCAFFNFPMQYPVSAFIGCFFLLTLLERSKHERQKLFHDDRY
jgi:hypothetical protein